jgi:hypothetical protein
MGWLLMGQGRKACCRQPAAAWRTGPATAHRSVSDRNIRASRGLATAAREDAARQDRGR